MEKMDSTRSSSPDVDVPPCEKTPADDVHEDLTAPSPPTHLVAEAPRWSEDLGLLTDSRPTLRLPPNRPDLATVRPAEDRLRRSIAALAPRYVCKEQRSSTLASWVFRGVDVATGQSVAIKVLKDSHVATRDAFIAEALLLSEIEHPGIVRYTAHGELPDGGAYLVTEWLEGEDLAHALARKPMPASEALTLIARAANVLAAAHARGIIHLDLKPSNLFLVGCDIANIRLLDFGIARLLRSASSDPVEGVIAGTPGYMAPEQILGDLLSPATDVFALGCVLFRCLVGRRIFPGKDIEVMAQTAAGAAPRPGSLAFGIHPALDDLVASMLRLDPRERPSDASAVLGAIAALPSEVLEGVAPSAQAMLNPGGLTAAQRVPLTVVLVRPEAGAVAPAAETREAPHDPSGLFETFADGTWIALPRSSANALDQALHAARLVLEVRERRPGAALAVATGRTVEGTAGTLLHAIVAEAEAILARARPGEALFDPAAAALLDGKFSFGRVHSSGVAELLGKAHPSSSAGGDGREWSEICLGRDTELDTLIEIAADAFKAPRASVVLLTGPAGIGKSHLLRAFHERLVRDLSRPRIWSCYGDSMAMGSALRLIFGLLESAEVPPESVLARVPRRDGPDAGAEPAGGQAGSVDEIHRSISATVDAELRHGPLVLQLEDVHWADLGSVRAIDYLLSAHAQRPLLVLATARPEVRELYPDLWHRRSLREIRLGELTDADVHRLISLRLGDDLGDEARTRIVQRARGNPFLLREHIRAEAEGHGGETPETALGVVQSRLRAFHSDARRVLRAASVLGESFTSRALAFLLGDASDPGDIERWLDLLTAREVVRRRDDGPSGKETFVFSHALVRDAAYDMLTESDRKLGHRLAAEWLEGPGRGQPTIVAQHYELAGERTAAGRCYLRATFEAFAIGDFPATVASAERALTFDLPQPDRGHLLAFAAHAYRLTGDVEASRRLSAEALQLLPPNTPLWWQAARTAMMAGASTARHGSRS
jgi:hypothetical protein